MSDTVTVRAVCTAKACHGCAGEGDLVVPRRALEAWRFGNLHIQDALPALSPADREWIKTGICGPCFDAMFKPHFEEDETE